MVSAVHSGGRRLHELAREGIEVERPPRRVTVHNLTIDPGADPGVFTLGVTCSSGTYIRVLAADIGAALGGGAHLRRLRRTAIGSFDAGAAVPLAAAGPDAVLPPSEALRDYPRLTVDVAGATDVSHGRLLDPGALAATGDGPWRVVDAEGALLAVYERHRSGALKPAVVLAPGT